MAKWTWIERTFSFDFPPAKMPDLLERVRGTPPRIEDRIKGLSHDALIGSDGSGWSIQQNIGHLIDLEPLHAGRIEQIMAGEAMLAAADMSNMKTIESRHDDRNITDLLAEFRTGRESMVARFESLDESDWGKAALHPRLNQPMRIVDIATSRPSTTTTT